MDIKLVTLFITISVVGVVHGCKYFTYTTTNTLQQPYFNETIQLKLKRRQKYLIKYMEKACLEEPKQFTNFTVTYYPSVGGYFVNAINGAFANFTKDQSYWQIKNQNGPLKVGISEYKPKKNDVILFNLTRWTGAYY